MRTPQSELIRFPTLSTSRLSWKVCRAAFAEREVLKDPQIDVVVPRVHRAGPLGDLAAMLAQVVVLLDEGVERVPLLLRGDVRAAAGGAIGEHDLALVARDVDQVVAARAVAVHVAGVDERVAVAARAGEAVALGDLDEEADRRAQAAATTA